MRRNHSDFIRAYMDYCRFSEAPAKFHLFTAIFTIASVLQRKCYSDQGHFKWVPNFYLVLVGPPGIVTKSTTASIGANLLENVPSFRRGPSSLTWQALIPAMSENSQTIVLPNGEFFTHSSLSLFVSELGTFLRPEDGQFVDVLTDLWDGQTKNWDRATRKHGAESIYNPWINILGCTTMSWIRQNLDEHFIGGGFASRTLFVYGDKKRQYDAFPKRTRSKINYDQEKEAALLTEDLCSMAEMVGEFEFTEDAYEWGEVWYRALWTDQNLKEFNEARLADYLARRQTHLIKVAMCVSAAQGDSMIISRDNLIQAEAILLQAEADMGKVFIQVGAPKQGVQTDELLAVISLRGVMLKSELWVMFMNQLGDYRLFEGLLTNAAKAKKIILRQLGEDILITTPELEA